MRGGVLWLPYSLQAFSPNSRALATTFVLSHGHFLVLRVYLHSWLLHRPPGPGPCPQRPRGSSSAHIRPDCGLAVGCPVFPAPGLTPRVCTQLRELMDTSRATRALTLRGHSQAGREGENGKRRGHTWSRKALLPEKVL